MEINKPTRIVSIDLVRGIIIILMALDHTRDYFHQYSYLHDPTDLAYTSVPIFFTRWITHFCAPAFMFLSGISAFLYQTKNGKSALSTFLITRGIWLLFLELFYVSLMWTFNPTYPAFFLQAIWGFGASMITLAILIHLPKPVLTSIGLILVLGHNMLDPVRNTSFIWSLLHQPNFSDFHFGHSQFFIAYPVIPYIGIIVLGYSIGNIYLPTVTPEQRKKWLRNFGLAAMLLFIMLRGINVYGDPAPWGKQPGGWLTLLSFLNTTKYPPSLLYTLMTLGPILLLLAYLERPLNSITARIIVFGRVPMFFYLVHIPFIHGLGIIAAMLSGYPAAVMVNLKVWVTSNAQLKGYGFSLPVVYGIWMLVILILYPVCKWFGKYKQTHQQEQKWLSYI
ncbi:heparan-alpha-glucosaminide N-acetyltransferase domain-containing protein [Chitinophaga sp.]|uniref:DUF1624 domain-containing protein n=1 Tax=Chitinophaga sp. TaxID=1869181 RepID=UPI0031D1EAC9